MLKTANVRYRIKGTGIYADAFNQPLGQSADLGRAYDASGQGRRATTWHASNTGPNAALQFTQSTLRTRSRDAVRKNPYAESAVAALETNIVGQGIKPKFSTGDSTLNEELAILWRDWVNEADADSRGSFYAMQSLAVRSMVESGEVFARFRNRLPGDVATVPLQLQLIESEHCTDENVRPPTRGKVINGVEFNLIGRRVAYWMYRDHPNDDVGNALLDNAIPVRVPASEVNHIYSCRRPSQVRGEPWLTRALIKMRDLDAYDDAELMRKKTAALFAGFITRPQTDDEFLPGEVDADGDGGAIVGLEPGLLQVLQPGEDVEFTSPTDVGSTYEAFMREQKRALAVASGILYEQLTGDYSQVNDRTFRAAANEFRRRAAMWQHHLVVFQFCRPVVERWLRMARTFGIVTPPASMPDREFLRVDFVPEGWRYIHPVQEVQADQLAVQAGFKSRSQVVTESGRDVEILDREIAEDNERADALGLTFTTDVGGASADAGQMDLFAAPVDDADEDDADEETTEGAAA